MNVGVWSILELIEDYGDELVYALISDFSTVIERDGQKKPNPILPRSTEFQTVWRTHQ